MARSTSFRLSDQARQALSSRAEEEGSSTTSLLEQLIIEGIAAREFPGVVHRGPAGDRRAAIAGGPDVWEVIARLQELSGDEEQRISVLTDEVDVHPRLIRLAIEYASGHPDEIEARIERHREAMQRSQQAAAQRGRLLA